VAWAAALDIVEDKRAFCPGLFLPKAPASNSILGEVEGLSKTFNCLRFVLRPPLSKSQAYWESCCSNKKKTGANGAHGDAHLDKNHHLEPEFPSDFREHRRDFNTAARQDRGWFAVAVCRAPKLCYWEAGNALVSTLYRQPDRWDAGAFYGHPGPRGHRCRAAIGRLPLFYFLTT